MKYRTHDHGGFLTMQSETRNLQRYLAAADVAHTGQPYCTL